MKMRTVLSALAIASSLAFASPAYAAFASNRIAPKLTRAVPVGGQQLCLDAAGDMWVLAKNGKVVEVSSAGSVLRTYAIRAKAIAVSPDGSTLYAIVSSGGSPGIAVINTATGQTEQTIVSSRMTGPTFLSISTDGSTLYVYNRSYHYASVLWLSAATGTVENRVTESDYSAGAPHLVPPNTMAVSSSGNTVWIPMANTAFGGNGNVLDANRSTSSVSNWEVHDGESVGYLTQGPNGTLYASDRSPANESGKMYVFALNPQTQSTNYKWNVPYPSSLARGSNFLFVTEDSTDTTNKILMINTSTKKFDGTIQNRNFGSIEQLAYSPSTNTLDVLTFGGLYLYSLPSASTPPTAPTSTASGPTVVIAAGWNLVDRNVASGQTAYWTGSAYATSAPSAAAGEWMDAPAATNVTLPPVSQSSYAVAIAAHTWGMIGNPFPEAVTVTLQSGDKADTYTNGAYAAASGTLTLQPGQGAWLYSASGGTYTIAPGSATSGTSAPPAPPAG